MDKLSTGLSALAAALVLGAGLAAAAVPKSPPSAIDWAWPGSEPAKPPTDPKPVHMSGSTRTYTKAQLVDAFHAVDWWPDQHPPAPRSVLDGRKPDVRACGYCHLPAGQGRPENASLAGLPAKYIIEQVADLKSGARPSRLDWGPSNSMYHSAVSATPQEIADAANYFSKLKYVSHTRVVETAEAPALKADGFIYKPAKGPKTKLGSRILEGPSDFEGFEHRDTRLIYTAYVPVGAIARGRDLAATGGNGRTLQCAACHNADFSGGVGPPLAGRSPTAMVRELYAIKTGARHGAGDVAMQPVVQKLSVADMIDLAAYVGSLKP